MQFGQSVITHLFNNPILYAHSHHIAFIRVNMKLLLAIAVVQQWTRCLVRAVAAMMSDQPLCGLISLRHCAYVRQWSGATML